MRIPLALTPQRLVLIAAILCVGVAAPLLGPAYQSQLTELLLFIVFALAWDLVGVAPVDPLRSGTERDQGR